MAIFPPAETPNMVTLEEAFQAYTIIVGESNPEDMDKPGRMTILGWDMEYPSLGALRAFVDYILYRRMNDFLPDNDQPTILDCGANIGYTVLNYKRKFPGAKIIAFEPDPQFVSCLKSNLKNNKANDVRIVEAAVWTQNGQTSWLCEGIDGSHITLDQQPGEKIVTVQTVDLAGYLDEPVDLLKLDIEGAEYDVVSHLRERLGNVKNILVECHISQDNIARFGQLLADLSGAGYKVSINTYGAWRDLIRQTPVLPNHWEQYVLVAGWREPISGASEQGVFLPYIGVAQQLEIEAALDNLKTQFLAHEADLNAQFLAREDKLKVQLSILEEFLKNYVLHGPSKIQRYRLGRIFKFRKEVGLAWAAILPRRVPLGDTSEMASHSLLLLFEDGKLLGPAYSAHDDIRKLGNGRYSHWGNTLYFSTSDGSDPKTNKRVYTVVCLKR
jgi:FkbM family methyltransferase